MTGETTTTTTRDWYISLIVKFISKKIAVNKHGSLLNGRLAEILKETYFDVCNFPQKASRIKINS